MDDGQRKYAVRVGEQTAPPTLFPPSPGLRREAEDFAAPRTLLGVTGLSSNPTCQGSMGLLGEALTSLTRTTLLTNRR